MMCEVCVGVALEDVTVMSQTIFSCAGDRLAQKMSSYAEVYNDMCSVRVCISVVCKIFSGTLYSLT